ncbi:MAG TPA: hypothetical protein VJT73_00685, partial [Polyangiaceae bacterium]|nr:hypothetical protein [Polyangiaceae bacterium]
QTPVKRLVPMDAKNSALWWRMNHAAGDDKLRMPKIGSLVVDVPNTKLIEDWITSIESCP